MKLFRIIITWLFFTCVLKTEIQAQERLYSNTFPLQDVVLLNGPFKHARDLNINVLLQYDVDRLLAPYRKEAGLPDVAESYPNWEGLDGHIGGHYLSALAINSAGAGDTACKNRLKYMILVLKACQDAHNARHASWASGYVGGVPGSEQIWTGIQKGDFTAFRKTWVPWYNLHKTYAGIRDAWLYTGNDTAKKMFLDFCDWGINITAHLSEEQMQSMLDNEHGGMPEIFADAYEMTGKEKYKLAAKRFSHKKILEPMATGIDNLSNKHANTQIPKIIGFQRIASLTDDDEYAKAASFFWETVTTNRTLALGGNSRREFFPSPAACTEYITDVEGPESCNTYNMLKLTEDLFRNHPSAHYVDYYERALYNHILSTQHPVHGGYVYFTPARPRHYRVYSAPNKAMWCCVGSGMENHGKYGQFIYTHQHDSLFVNLFIPSVLNWRDQKVTLKQETDFPYKEETRLTITKGSSKRLKLLIRYPSWVTDGTLSVSVNGESIRITEHPSSFILLDRVWKKGDVVLVKLPMHNSVESLPNVPNYVAILHGPILLGAKTGTEDLAGLVAGDGRWGHIAGGNKQPITKAPIIVADSPGAIAAALKAVPEHPLHFTTAALKTLNTTPLQLEPFFGIHDARYMMYWMTLRSDQSQHYLDSLAKSEQEKLALQRRTVDFVAPGEQQPEADHAMQQSDSRSGNRYDEFWREASNGGYFSYSMATERDTSLDLQVRFWGNEEGDEQHAFDVYIDDEYLVTENITEKWKIAAFREMVYTIPGKWLLGKEQIRVRFQAKEHKKAGPIYYVRLVKRQK